MNEPFVLFDANGGLIFMAVRLSTGQVAISGSGGHLDPEHVARLQEWFAL